MLTVPGLKRNVRITASNLDETSSASANYFYFKLLFLFSCFFFHVLGQLKWREKF